MRDAGCLKIVFGLESFNQRVMDFMKKGIKQEWVRRIAGDCVDLGIAVHCYIIVGFPTEKEEEAQETMNFIVENERLHTSYGFSCQPCLFDLEKEAPIMSDPGSYGIRRIMRPSAEDLSLGFFYEVIGRHDARRSGTALSACLRKGQRSRVRVAVQLLDGRWIAVYCTGQSPAQQVAQPAGP